MVLFFLFFLANHRATDFTLSKICGTATCSVCLRFTGVFARRFFIWNKIFVQPREKYFTYFNQKCYFLLWLFQLRCTLIQHFQVFHVNKPNTCFAKKKDHKGLRFRSYSQTCPCGHLYAAVIFYVSCHRKFHMNWTSFKIPSLLPFWKFTPFTSNYIHIKIVPMLFMKQTL
jgi:hypothetical protein